MFKISVPLTVLSLIFSGCMSSPGNYDYGSPRFDTALSASAVGYAEPHTLTSSLFKSDQVVLGDDAINKILSSELQLADNAKIAIIRFPGAQNGALRYYGSNYWRSEGYLKTQQKYVDTIIEKLSSSEHVSKVVLLPSLLTPSDATIPVLREAAVRLQSDLLLVYRITSDIYHKWKLLSDDQVKAYSTCEAVLLDVRTGIIPFTSVTTKEVQVKKEKQDLEITETMRRAESLAVMDSLNSIAQELVLFLNSSP